jgi:hypothetical protein
MGHRQPVAVAANTCTYFRKAVEDKALISRSNNRWGRQARNRAKYLASSGRVAVVILRTTSV